MEELPGPATDITHPRRVNQYRLPIRHKAGCRDLPDFPEQPLSPRAPPQVREPRQARDRGIRDPPVNDTPPTDTSVRPYLWMLLGSFTFAIMGTLAHDVTVLGCDWQLVACARAGLVCLFALFLAWYGGVRLVLGGSPTLWVRSIAGSLSMICTFYGFSRLPVATVLTLTNTFPIWVAILSWPVLGRFPRGPVWVAVVCAVSGVFLMHPPDASSDMLPLLGCLAAALFTSVAMIGLHHLGDIDSRAVVVHFSAVAFGFCLASCFVFQRHHDLADNLRPGAVVLLLGVGLSATVGQLCLTWAFTTGAPTKVSVIALTQIVFALVFDLGRGVVPHELTLLGIALVVAPSAWLMLHSRD
jgi:drug/metabolite transporter (DMT)-like permease